MPVPSERLSGLLSPKWLVAGAALATDGLLFNYDLRLGLAASVLIGVAAIVWLYLALRYGPWSGAPSIRSPLVERCNQQAANRRKSLRSSGPEQGAQPTSSA